MHARERASNQVINRARGEKGRERKRLREQSREQEHVTGKDRRENRHAHMERDREERRKN